MIDVKAMESGGELRCEVLVVEGMSEEKPPATRLADWC